MEVCIERKTCFSYFPTDFFLTILAPINIFSKLWCRYA